jgi:hypothetical protein
VGLKDLFAPGDDWQAYGKGLRRSGCEALASAKHSVRSSISPGTRCGTIAMRRYLVLAGATSALTSSVLAAEVSNFDLVTTSDLVALCSARSDDPLYAEALQFCYGYMAGVSQFHRALLRADDIKPLACPQHEVTREALARVFLDWVQAHPGAMDKWPADSVKHAAAASWPCGG